MVNISMIDWDSNFFGYKVALLQFSQESVAQLEQTIGMLREENVKLAYSFIRPEDVISNETIINCSGILVDEKITYTYSLDKQEEPLIDNHVQVYNKTSVSAELVKLTLQSGIHSRFRIDTNFQNDEYGNLYREWIKRSVSRELADQVFVYEEEGQILGFITMKISENHGSIGLLAVDENCRGKSIGKKLITSSMAYFQNKNITMIEVVTQRGNHTACRFYESCGFKVNDLVNVYHLWIK